MIITKTKFINYTKCPRYINEDKPLDIVTYDDYKKEENNANYQDIMDNLGVKTLDERHLETMLPYYNEVEKMAAYEAKKHFKGKFNFSKKTYKQTKFSCQIGNINYLCYVDVYNEDKEINIIEAKSTTTTKILKNGIFEKKNNIYYPKEISDKLLDRLNDAGHYIYDLAVQRYIIEKTNPKKKVNYYLAVLNSNYIFDGTYKNGKPDYKEINGESLINLINVNDITEKMQKQVDEDRKLLEKYLFKYLNKNVPDDYYCDNALVKSCLCLNTSLKILNEKNSITNFLDSSRGFKKGSHTYTVIDLIKKGYKKIVDVPDEYLNREKNKIQKQTIIQNKPYINKEKIIQGLKLIKYPIYHLDFETFPCPLPRFKGEKPYTQSVFQFSLHIQNEEGKLDKIKDHYGYLAKDNNDHRLELIKEMCDHIKDGTVLVYNDSFEKTRLLELSNIFPEYKDKLLNIRNNVFDLLNLVKSNTKLYEKLNFSKEEAKMFNYYHPNMCGSFSIKKVLPVLSNLTYENMEIGNGVEALLTYANFQKMDQKTYKNKYNELIEYCCQDTYAMYCVLEGLRNIVVKR